MARYIDADNFIEHIKDLIEECENPDVATQPITYGTVLGLKGALSYAETLPTADVVGVVRCKDCKCYYPRKHEERVGWCKKIGINMPYEHFCSYGERKVE